jgi:uncharacterized protein (TIGR02680 family)
MSDNRWQAHRAGILNYWYYDEVEFYFADGRLLLRGSNGSGKSVTMQSLVTVLLDGIKRADRLDSFGSKSRTMDDYLLGEKEISDYDERTGYLFLEYKRENSDQYITTGIGLHARRGSSKVDFWGFILQNGRRIGHDIQLYHVSKNPENGQEQKLPLTKRELENAIGQDGRVTTEQREYMAMVNQYIFGYKDIQKYEELMKLLIQLRSPKLSRDFKPSVIYEILNGSLPTLSDDDLRPLAETLENMEKTRLAIEQLKREQGAFQAICTAYTAYNTAVLAERAMGVAKCDDILNNLAKKEQQQRDLLAQAAQQAEEARSKQQELAVEERALRQEQADLQENEAYKAAEKKKETQLTLEREERDCRQREGLLSDKRRRELDLSEQVKAEEYKLYEVEKQVAEVLEDLGNLAQEADFSAHMALSQSFKLNDGDVAGHFMLWRNERQNHIKALQQLHKRFIAYDNLQQRVQQNEQELGEENRRLDQYSYEYQQLMEELERERENIIKAFYEWKTSWQRVVSFTGDQENQLVGCLRELYSSSQWLEVEQYLSEVVSHHQRELDGAIGQVRAAIQQVREQLTIEQEELQQLREKKEAEPELGEAYKQARASLEQHHIAFLPLYEATEFRLNVPAQVRERLESALLEAGLLNAIILESNELAGTLPETMRGNVLFSGDVVMLADSLINYLEPVPGESGISAARIADILASIVVDDNLYPSPGGTSLNIEQGGYCLGSIAGRAAERPEALFIGRQARENHRRRQIAAKEQEIAGLTDELTRQQGQEQELLTRNEELARAKEEFPSHQGAQLIYDKARGKANEVEQQRLRLQERDEQQKKLTLELRRQRLDITEMRGETTLGFSAQAYEEALSMMNEYGEEYNRLTLLQADYAHTAELAGQHRQDVEYISGEVDMLKGELQKQENTILQLKKTIEALTRQLEDMDAAAVEARISAVISRLNEIPQELMRTSRLVGDNERNKATLTADLSLLTRHQTVYGLLRDKWKGLLQAELQRGFFAGDKKALQKIIQERQKSRETKSLHSLAQQVENQYAKHRDEIAEYRFSLRESMDEVGDFISLSPEEEEQFLPRWEALRDYAVRQLAVTDIGGRGLSPYEQLDQLKEHLLEQENLLSEQDKQIYQEIILNSIGRTISEKIYGAEDWIKKMNNLMTKSETSSALRFRLEWKPLIGDDDDEMDTAELVELLHSDPELMKEEDMQRLEQHFSSRIRRARETAEIMEKDADAFQASVREQLDYRKWFRFRLYYDKGEQIKRRELTDKAFFRFSGGEKAMAMYVPLFSAAYSRYLDAGSDAPRLITLDEAFAGVDEQNMRDMFRLVEQMGFNYIMNSQAIWGDYDVVPSLNIYELLRPLNANYVSVLGYHWNGTAKEVMVEEPEHG